MSQRRNRRVSSMVSDIPSGLLADARGNKGSDGQKTHERRRSSVVQPPQQRQRRRSSLAIQAKIKVCYCNKIWHDIIITLLIWTFWCIYCDAQSRSGEIDHESAPIPSNNISIWCLT